MMNNEEDIIASLDRNVPHISGNHESCKEATWCKYKDDPASFK